MNADKLGYSEGIISIVVNLLLFALKFWAGVVSGSVALIADAWHTLSDSVSSVMVVVGIKLSNKNPDKDHPFGHGRWIEITSNFIGFLLLIIGYGILVESYKRFLSQIEADFGVIAISVTVVSILFKEALAQYAFYSYRKTQNPVLKADAWHHRSDALSSVLVLIAIFLKDYFWWIDSFLGGVIAIMLFIVTFSIFRTAISNLLGREPSDELKNRIHKIIVNSEPYNVFAHEFKFHDYGKHKELTFHIKIDGNKSILYGHDLATRLECEIKQKLNINTTIHVEPFDDNNG